jgi:hypothetical protein
MHLMRRRPSGKSNTTVSSHLLKGQTWWIPGNGILGRYYSTRVEMGDGKMQPSGNIRATHIWECDSSHFISVVRFSFLRAWRTCAIRSS